jgi:hypothetical protein
LGSIRPFRKHHAPGSGVNREGRVCGWFRAALASRAMALCEVFLEYILSFVQLTAIYGGENSGSEVVVTDTPKSNEVLVQRVSRTLARELGVTVAQTTADAIAVGVVIAIGADVAVPGLAIGDRVLFSVTGKDRTEAVGISPAQIVASISPVALETLITTGPHTTFGNAPDQPSVYVDTMLVFQRPTLPYSSLGGGLFGNALGMLPVAGDLRASGLPGEPTITTGPTPRKGGGRKRRGTQ